MASGPATNGALNDMSLEDIESQIASLQLLKSQKILEAAPKKSKKDMKKEKAGKIEVKVPKVCPRSNTVLIYRERKVEMGRFVGANF